MTIAELIAAINKLESAHPGLIDAASMGTNPKGFPPSLISDMLALICEMQEALNELFSETPRERERQ